MNSRTLRAIFRCVIACVLGVVCGEVLCASAVVRSALGQVCGRGKLVALVHGAGIYDADVRGDDSPDTRKARLIAEAEVAFRARHEKIPRSNIQHEYALLEFQLPDKGTWNAALNANRLCSWTLGSRITRNLRSAQWIERQLAGRMVVSAEECQAYFEEHPQEFQLPERFRAAHIFLAAPADTPQETVDMKRRAAEQLLKRLDEGEKFSDLVTFSEDEATKKNQGDLGYFSDFRMPADFMASVRPLQTGETSRVVQTALGFHLIRLSDRKPARQMDFGEAEPEIRNKLENEKRRVGVQELAAHASSQRE